MTKLSAGMKIARDELTVNCRLRAFRLMVLMTDGMANQPGNLTTVRSAVITSVKVSGCLVEPEC